MIYKTTILSKDIKKFANFSSDKNPIHLNKKFARRQFHGAQISHGALLIEKFLLFFFKKNDYLIKNFICYFQSPCEVNSNIIYKYRINNSVVKCNIKSKNKNICYFEFHFLKKKIEQYQTIKSKNFQKIKKLKNYSDLKKLLNKKKKFIKSFDKKKNIFVNILYNLSRVIGMEVPGYFSLFSNFKVKFDLNNQKNYNFYSVKNIIKKINLIETNYFFKGYSITSNSFLLNSPLDFNKILNKKYLQNKKIKNVNKQVLILGGSRGLGLVSTFFFLSRGYKVVSTYAMYNNYLKNIKTKNLKIIKYNIMDNMNFEKIKTFAKNSELIMFFASPKILNHSENSFDKEYFNLMDNYNKVFINKILKNLKNKKIFYPSSIFINSLGENYFVEYIKSKKLMEMYLKNTIIKNDLFIPRLPRFNTDQNIFNLNDDKVESILNFEKYLKKFENK